MDRGLLERLDSYPYRHRVGDVMDGAPASVPAQATLDAAAQAMKAAGQSAIFVDPDGREGGPGILTERDLVHRIAESGAAALETKAGAAMSRPLVAVEADSFLFVAIGRMARLRLRHLAVVDGRGRPVGLLTARMVMRQRASQALIIGDAVGAAETPGDLKTVQAGMPELAEALLAEGIEAPEIAGVISAVLREVSARAAALAAAELTAELGPAPAPWAFLVLGSGGRGESLLSADQDNALVHAGSDEADDAWFARLGERAAEILDSAGIPYCKGGVMAARPAWRHSLARWRETIEEWTGRAEGENLLSVDIFYDFRRVHGDAGLAEALRAAAMAAARRPMLPRMMVQELASLHPPLTLFGGLQTRDGRLDLKLGGLFPLVAGARAMALRHGIAETSTEARLMAVAALGLLREADLTALLEARRLFMALILEQQVRDLRAGQPPGTRIEVAHLSSDLRRRLKEALKQAAVMAYSARDVVAAD